jgi:WD40 repeat protein
MCVCGSQDGTLVATCAKKDRLIYIWDAVAYRKLKDLAGHARSVVAICFSSDAAMLVSGSNDLTVAVWDVALGIMMRSINAHVDNIACVCISRNDAKIASGARDKTIRIWDISTTTDSSSVLSGTMPVYAIDFYDDGNRLAVGQGDGFVVVWNCNAGAIILSYQAHRFLVHTVKVVQDKIFSASWENAVKIWNAETGSLLCNLADSGEMYGATWSMAINADGSKVAAGYPKGAVIVWDVETETICTTMRVIYLRHIVRALCFIPSAIILL